VVACTCTMLQVGMHEVSCMHVHSAYACVRVLAFMQERLCVVLGDDVLGGGLGAAATAFAARFLAFTPALQSSSLRFFDILIW
jgi:hypothetical protein